MIIKKLLLITLLSFTCLQQVQTMEPRRIPDQAVAALRQAYDNDMAKTEELTTELEKLTELAESEEGNHIDRRNHQNKQNRTIQSLEQAIKDIERRFFATFETFYDKYKIKMGPTSEVEYEPEYECFAKYLVDRDNYKILENAE